ncbi:MAG: hypothetical protein WCG75_06615, partial [Armatimonadota bacterium]
IIPGPKTVAGLVRRFGKNDYGIVTSLNDSQLPMLRAELDDQTLVDVKSFGEVVHQVHRMTGFPSRRIATSRQILTAIGLVCAEIDASSPFRKVADMAGFHECLLEVFREAGQWGVIGTDNHDLGKIIKSHPELVKVSELVELFNDVIQILEKANATIVSKMIAECLDSTIDMDGQDSRLLFFMGSTIHPAAIKWIQWLVAEGAEVQIILDRHATDGDIFHLSNVVAKEFGETPAAPGAGTKLLNNLFAKSESHGANLDWVEVHCCGDPLSESEWALRKCLEINNFSKTAILTRNIDQYGPILIHAGESLGVPIDTRRRIPLLASGFAKVTLSILRAIASDDVRNLGNPFRTSYFGVSDISELLDTAHSGPLNDWEELIAELAKLEEPDEYLVETLQYVIDFRLRTLERGRSFAEWHAELKQFLEGAPWQKNAQERDLRAQTSLLSNLAQDATIQLVQNPDAMSYVSWLNHADSVWQRSDVSVPSEENGILLVSSPEELGEIENLLVLGMLEGSFPRRRSENPILSDELKKGLSDLIKGPALNNSFDVAKSERDIFYRVCACPSKALYFSYPMSDGESDNVPAFYLEEIRRICQTGDVIVHPRRHLTPPTDQCKSEYDRELSARLSTATPKPVNNVLVDPRAIELVRFDMKNVQPRTLRSLVDCNYKFAAERLVPEHHQPSDHWGRMLEVPRRANLLTIANEKLAKAELGQVLIAYLDELRPQLPAWEFDMIEHGSSRLIEGLIEREFLSREVWGRDPSNTKLDLKFGDPQLNPEIFKYQLTGRVAGITDQNGIRTIHLYRRTPPKDPKEEALDKYLIEYGMYFAAAWYGVTEVRVEIDGLSEHRTTLLFSDTQTLEKRADQLLVLNLARQFGNKTELAEGIKNLLRAPKAIAVSGQMMARAGDHCQYCSFTDLCRQSQGSSEEFSDLGVTNG